MSSENSSCCRYRKFNSAVQQDGDALEYASAELNADHEVLIVIQGIRKMAAALRNQAVLAAAWLATLQ